MDFRRPRRHRTTLLAGLVAGLMVASLAIPAAHAAQSACTGADEPTRTFVVKVKVLNDTYQVGENAKFRVRVNRVVEGHDLGPVNGAQVSVGVALGDVYLGGGGTTDAEGRSLIKVAIKRYAPSGFADVLVYASKLLADAPCHTGYEYEFGDVEKLRFFRVAR